MQTGRQSFIVCFLSVVYYFVLLQVVLEAAAAVFAFFFHIKNGFAMSLRVCPWPCTDEQYLNLPVCSTLAFISFEIHLGWKLERSNKEGLKIKRKLSEKITLVGAMVTKWNKGEAIKGKCNCFKSKQGFCCQKQDPGWMLLHSSKTNKIILKPHLATLQNVRRWSFNFSICLNTTVTFR